MRVSRPSLPNRQSSTLRATSEKRAKFVPAPSNTAPSGCGLPGHVSMPTASVRDSGERSAYPPIVRSEPRDEGEKRVLVEGVWPEIDAGAYPVKRVIGDRFTVAADLVVDGHDMQGGALLYRHEKETSW